MLSQPTKGELKGKIESFGLKDKIHCCTKNVDILEIIRPNAWRLFWNNSRILEAVVAIDRTETLKTILDLTNKEKYMKGCASLHDIA